jgi:hypothetical protein
MEVSIISHVSLEQMLTGLFYYYNKKFDCYVIQQEQRGIEKNNGNRVLVCREKKRRENRVSSSPMDPLGKK